MKNKMNLSGITYALIIAVENYNQHKNFKKVTYASKDLTDLKKALLGLGIHEYEIIPLIDKDATYTAINTELKQLSRRVTKDDRIIIFFAGHGVYVEEKNWIVPVDAYINSLKETCISIGSILGHLKKSSCKKNLIFLDCCHSGFEPGDIIRDISTDFLADELLYNYRNEEYCCGFASSKSDQKSISNPELKNGVWSHFLIKALTGDAGKIYEQGILFSDRLQSYLNKNVSEFVKMNTADKKDQTPIIFGNQTDKFPIADLNSIFEEREKNKKVSDVSFTNITLLSEEDGEVKSLPGFKKGFHRVPNDQYSRADSFIKDCGYKLIFDEINELSEMIRKKMKYKRKEMEVWSESGTGTINTPDFTYSMEIYQSDDDPADYVLLRKLEGFSYSNAILEDELNSIFSSHFEKLEFELPKGVNIEELIDTIESFENDSPVTVEYNPADPSTCVVSIEGLDYDIEVTNNTISITSNNQTSPINLITAYQKTHKAILDNPEIKLLNE